MPRGFDAIGSTGTGDIVAESAPEEGAAGFATLWEHAIIMPASGMRNKDLFIFSCLDVSNANIAFQS
jgi:hypothetical protein